MTAVSTKNQELEQSGGLPKENMQPEDQFIGALVDDNSLNSALKELLIVIIFAIFSTLLMIHLDAFEKLFTFSRSIEHYQFDELAVFLPSFAKLRTVLII